MRVDLIMVFVWGLKLTDCRILITVGMFWRDGGGGGAGWDYEVSRRGGEMVRRCSLASELDGWLDGGPGHAGPGLSGSGLLG